MICYSERGEIMEKASQYFLERVMWHTRRSTFSLGLSI